MKFIVYALLVFCMYLVACDKEKTSETNSSTKDKWGGISKADYINNCKNYPLIKDYITSENKSMNINDRMEKQEKVCGCVYDEETKYLENTVGESKIKPGVDYRMEVPKDAFEKSFNNCYRRYFK